MLYHDSRYLQLISTKLRNFKQKSSSLWNFSCPYCGDSSTNHLKARGYCFEGDGGLIYYCHNCQESAGFGKFLQHVDPAKYKEYLLEKFQDFNKRQDNVVDTFPKVKQFIKPYKEIDLPTISMLPEDHFAREYVSARMIPEKFWNEIWFAEDYKEFLDKLKPDHGKELIPDDMRIVVIFTDFDGNVIEVSGRTLRSSQAKNRYLTLRLSKEPGLFGAHKLKSGPVYVTEGPFDSMFLPNAVAPGNAHLEYVADALMGSFNKITLVYDKEPRNTHFVNIVEQAVKKQKYNVCLLPESFPGKDLNEAVYVGGLTTDEIKKIIDDHTYCGLQLAAEFARWKKT